MDASQGQHGSHRQPAPPPASASQFPLHTHPYPVYQLPLNPQLNPQLNPPKNYRPRRRNPHGGPPKRKKPKPEKQRAPVPYGYGHHPIYHQLPPDAVAETYGGTASTDEVSDEEPYDSYPISNERDSGGDDSQEQLQQVLEKLDNQSEAFNAQHANTTKRLVDLEKKITKLEQQLNNLPHLFYRVLGKKLDQGAQPAQESRGPMLSMGVLEQVPNSTVSPAQLDNNNNNNNNSNGYYMG